MQYRIIDLVKNQSITLRGETRLFTVTDQILMRQQGDKTIIRYTADFRFAKALQGIAHKMQEPLDGVGKRAVDGLRAALEDEPELPVATRGSELADKLVLPGAIGFSRLGYRSARKQWAPLSSQMYGKHVLVTGATSGIGLAAAVELARRGARLTLVGRDREKCDAAIAQVIEESGNQDVSAEIADLSLMGDVQALAERLLAKDEAIDVLVNNAGALFRSREETAEGLEKSFALLLLSPYVLTERLHPLLQKANSARVINVLSGGMYTQGIDVDDLQSEQGKYAGSAAYARAKRGLAICTEYWAEKWQDDNIAVNAMHPGWADTPGIRHALPGFHKLTRSILRDSDEGADTICWLAAAPEAARAKGQFWLDRQPHSMHVFERTRETRQDREALLQALQTWMQSTAN